MICIVTANTTSGLGRLIAACMQCCFKMHLEKLDWHHQQAQPLQDLPAIESGRFFIGSLNSSFPQAKLQRHNNASHSGAITGMHRNSASSVSSPIQCFAAMLSRTMQTARNRLEFCNSANYLTNKEMTLQVV